VILKLDFSFSSVVYHLNCFVAISDLRLLNGLYYTVFVRTAVISILPSHSIVLTPLLVTHFMS